MSFEQDAVIIEPRNEHKASVIWLHGLGADGHDFEAIVPELNLDPDLGIHFIFPNAPFHPVTINGGMVMRAWYDVKSPNLREMEDVESINASHELINHYIDAEIERGVPANKIILAGFSQGGAITLHTGLRRPEALAGLLALSTYLPVSDLLDDEASSNRDIPIMMAHGIADPVIPVDQGRSSCQALKDKGYSVEWHEYMMQHAVCLEEINAIADWIRKVLT
ncbi:MAG: carboxylesterase [Proteobacteria bacterium]|nr:carboxylesterase [Pseudomonadota bacterium]NOG61015.1 carboxylesterase [Pseudomonadota bacterium]